MPIEIIQKGTLMRGYVVIAVSTCFIVGTATAETKRAAEASECKEITARLIEATNASFERYSPSGDNVFLKKPDMRLSCASHRLTGVALNWDASGFPSNEWFGLLARAGRAVTGVDVKRL